MMWWPRILGAVLAVAVVTGIAFLIHTASGEGHRTRRAIAECHTRGPAYHYWQERNRCVMYVTP